MQNSMIVGLAAALASGVAIGLQVTLNSVAGRLAGAFRAGLLINAAGGTLAGLVILALVLAQGRGAWQINRQTIVVAAISGALGILIVTGVAYSLQRTGVAAGIAGLFLGQMAIGVVVDMLGSTGAEPIPLDPRRILGLVVMAIALVLLLPRN